MPTLSRKDNAPEIGQLRKTAGPPNQVADMVVPCPEGVRPRIFDLPLNRHENRFVEKFGLLSHRNDILVLEHNILGRIVVEQLRNVNLKQRDLPVRSGPRHFQDFVVARQHPPRFQQQVEQPHPVGAGIAARSLHRAQHRHDTGRMKCHVKLRIDHELVHPGQRQILLRIERQGATQVDRDQPGGLPVFIQPDQVGPLQVGLPERTIGFGEEFCNPHPLPQFVNARPLHATLQYDLVRNVAQDGGDFHPIAVVNRRVRPPTRDIHLPDDPLLVWRDRPDQDILQNARGLHPSGQINQCRELIVFLQLVDGRSDDLALDGDGTTHLGDEDRVSRFQGEVILAVAPQQIIVEINPNGLLVSQQTDVPQRTQIGRPAGGVEGVEEGGNRADRIAAGTKGLARHENLNAFKPVQRCNQLQVPDGNARKRCLCILLEGIQRHPADHHGAHLGEHHLAPVIHDERQLL